MQKLRILISPVQYGSIADRIVVFSESLFMYALIILRRCVLSIARTYLADVTKEVTEVSEGCFS